jgi:hypothetical protein
VTGCFFSCLGLRISRPPLFLPDIGFSLTWQRRWTASAAHRKGCVVESGCTPAETASAEHKQPRTAPLASVAAQ